MGLFYTEPIFPGTARGIIGAASKLTGNHVMTIAGRKKIGDQCYFHVNNSWGTDEPWVSSDIVLGKNGDLYISEKAMTESIVSLTYLK